MLKTERNTRKNKKRLKGQELKIDFFFEDTRNGKAFIDL